MTRRHPAAWAGLGVAELLGHGTLEAVWALGDTWGVTDPGCRPWGCARVLRVVAWLGVVVLGIASVAGLLVTVPGPAGADPLATWVHLVVYGSLGLVAPALCRLALLRRRPRVP